MPILNRAAELEYGTLAELHTGDAATRQATAQTVERLFLRGQNKRSAG